ncbi:MAG TPA: deaminase, partial [Candidatus Nanoarchaeia archaeon]|nr:deaminase [Candidatus Nanoarchaeia archaeon]
MPNQFLSNALHIAYSNLGSVSQNPSVGAVIVKNNVIIAEGVTQPLGQDHAEIAAIKKCTPAQLNGATLYVTLEPCCHSNKRTPPCTTKIIESKFKEVIIG